MEVNAIRASFSHYQPGLRCPRQDVFSVRVIARLSVLTFYLFIFVFIHKDQKMLTAQNSFDFNIENIASSWTSNCFHLMITCNISTLKRFSNNDQYFLKPTEFLSVNNGSQRMCPNTTLDHYLILELNFFQVKLILMIAIPQNNSSSWFTTQRHETTRCFHCVDAEALK